MTGPSRGDVVRVSFPDDRPPAEFDGAHRAVVLQNDGCNNRFDSTVVVPISSGAAQDRLTEVDIPSHEPVDHHSHAVVRQVQAVSIPDRIQDVDVDPSAWKDGELSDDTLHEIEDRLSTTLRIS